VSQAAVNFFKSACEKKMTYVAVYQTWRINDSSKHAKHVEAESDNNNNSANNHVTLPFAQAMQMARIQTGLSIAKLAQCTGIAADKLAAFERGDDKPSAEVMQLVENALSKQEDTFSRDVEMSAS
jgi:ribosome-binding protein aMBF1 (putative translation factor)